MTKISCAAALVRALENEGVRHIFIGPPGEHVVELYDAFLDSQQIQGYLTTNEYTLSFMADGYSRASGDVGVFTCVPGPGVTNALTGITEAYLDSSPIVGIVSDVRAHIDEVFQLHQMRQMDVLAPVIKQGFRITGPEEVNEVVSEAFHVARSGEPGPAIIEIPCDIYSSYGVPREAKFPKEMPLLDEERIAKFAGMLKEAKRCGIYIGRGCYHSGAEVKQLSEILQAPVASSISGRGICSEDFPLSVGFGFGSNGSKIAQDVFKECDLVLAIGCKFAEVSTGSYSFKIPKALIHVDINPDNLNKNFKTEHVLEADAKYFLKGLLRKLKDFAREKDIKLQKRIQRGKEEFQSQFAELSNNGEHVDPGKFYHYLRDKMESQDTLTVDIGNHELWAISCFSVLAKGTFLCPTNFSSMGFAIPSAIAAQIVRPHDRAICCVGDGGFLMSGFEILTAVRHNLPVAFFVFNDGALGITKGLQERLFKRKAFVDLHNPGYRDFAQSFGVPYFKMANDAEIEPTLDQVWRQKGPILVDVRVSYDKMSPYLKGIVAHRIKTMPWKEKLHILRRMARRTFFPE